MSERGLQQRIVAWIERERRVGSQNLRDVRSLALRERVAAGEAIGDLELERREGSRLVLACPENHSRFRAGDLLWLSAGEGSRGGIEVNFVDHDPATGRLVVEIDRFRAAAPAIPRGTLALDRRELDLTARLIDAVGKVFREPAFAHARALLEGGSDAGPAAPMGDATDAARHGLDAVQTEAFLEATSRRCRLIQGPPGSGKTRLAAAIVDAFVRRGKRVVVAAFTHRAVDQLLERVAATCGDVAVYKVERGRVARSDGAIRAIASPRDVPSDGRACVVGVTTHSAVGLLGGREFDLALVDEAGQVSLAHACAVLPLARRHVLVGDHRQLPPLLVASHEDPLARRSLFEHLHAALGSRMLTVTYRLNADLCAFPSRSFYGGELRSSEASRSRRLELGPGVDPALAASLAPEPCAAIVEMRHLGARILAPEEASLAAALVAAAIAGGLPPEEAAVIAPHRAQGTRIRTLLRRLLPDLEPARQPLVDTVERLQGGERDLIVLSLTASDPEALKSEEEFFFSPQRLNVSLTRARKKLIVLMSPALLDAFPDSPAALRGADLLRRLWRQLPHVAIESSNSSRTSASAGATST